MATISSRLLNFFRITSSDERFENATEKNAEKVKENKI